VPRGRQCRELSQGAASGTGIRLEVIDRETEATLVVGCSPLLDPSGRGAILFDIGGGSGFELVRIERDPRRTPCRGSRRGMSTDSASLTLAVSILAAGT
jgi:exopolyphosphatase/guanosine-5'-triphosphate,3'-diphosphate pyrophosphatase